MPISTLAKAKSGEQPCPAYNVAGYRHGKETLTASRTNRSSTKAEGPGCRPGTGAHQPMPTRARAAARTATTKTVAQPELNDRGRDRARGK